MQLNEKILYCRKKAGLSQEELAERVGVSRQAVSKWELGDATPELDKLLTLARTFGVTTDWLLSDAPPAPEPEPEAPHRQSEETSPGSWVDSLPGLIGRLARRWGWLAGVYLAVAGLGFTLVGGLARYLARQMFNNSIFNMTGPLGDGVVFFDDAGNQIGSGLSQMAANNPVSILGGVILAFGILLLAAGVILAIVLKKKSRDWENRGQ